MYIDPPELAEEIINSVVQHPGALPLLSFLLNEMFELWRRNRQQYEDRALNWEDYRRLGGVVGALQSKANALFDGSELHLQDALKIAMLRMAAFEAGNVAGRRVLKNELDFGNAGRNKDISTALDLLTEARLIVRGRDVNEEPFIEPAHDALVNSWGYLWDWIEEYGKENIMLLRQLNAPAVAYQKMRREDGSKEPGNVFTQETPLWKIDPRLPAVFEFYKKHPQLVF